LSSAAIYSVLAAIRAKFMFLMVDIVVESAAVHLPCYQALGSGGRNYHCGQFILYSGVGRKEYQYCKPKDYAT
jgi:hypothetical protein